MIVMLHGNPETPVIWDPLRRVLADQYDIDEVITPQLPGFGCPTEPHFAPSEATKETYAAWFSEIVEGIVADHGPIDFLGHDWGGAIGMRVVSQRPDLFASWTTDILGLFHTDYVWHDFAQIWQTPGAGEEYFAATLAAPVEDRVALYESVGIPRATGEQLVAVADDTMSTCILTLYRSAAQPAMTEWGAELSPAAGVPGLCLTAPHDPFVRTHDLAPIVAASLGATVAEITDQGHWWMLGDPALGARLLSEFWGRR
jgi:pimeloyl-ACP methyl ester carboxylesterase